MEGLVEHTIHLDDKYKGKTSTKKRHRAYLDYFSEDLCCTEENKYSSFLYTSNTFVPFENHIIESINVLKSPYSICSDNKFESKTLVNLGTYFRNIRSINFWVDVNDYKNFITQYTPIDYMSFCFEHNRVQEYNKVNKDKINFPFKVYASSAKDKVNKFIVQEIMFYRSNPCHTKKTGRDSIVMHYELNDIYNQKPLQQHNLKIIKYLQYGHEDVSLSCLASGELLEEAPVLTFNADMYTNCWTLHHIVFINGKSILKTGIDPAKLIKTIRLDDPDQKDGLIDILGTIILSKSEHAKIHHCVHTGGIEMHTNHAIPWALKCKENFDEVCKKYSLDLEYSSFYNTLKSEFYTSKENNT